MKKYLKISNKGLLDTKIIALMGGTTKSNDSYKIGQFGSGLKYSMAYLFRNNIDFRIVIDGDPVSLETKQEVISNSTFDIIYVEGVRTSITTQMGQEWSPWMIVREIYSNALDEGDANYSIEEKIKGEDGKTCFFIELNADFLEVYNNWSKYFVVGQIPFYEDNNVKIYPQSGELRIYKQGILIHTRKTDSLFNYDIKNAHLNELREYKGYLEHDVEKCICGLTDKKVIQYFIENLNEDYYEANIDYDHSYMGKFGPVWEETLKGAKVIHQKAVENLEARGIEVDKAKNIIVPEKLYKGLSKRFESIGALRVSKKVNDFFEIYNERLQDRISKALKMLENADYYIEPELSFIYGIFGDKRVQAQVDLDKKKIYISEKLLDKDFFSICSILVEENEHYKTGFSDETREFQQHFIDLYTKEKLGETITAVLS